MIFIVIVYVSLQAFDPYNISYGELPDGLDFSGSDEEGPSSGGQGPGDNFVSSSSNNTTTAKSGGTSDSNVTCYRFASVGQDTMLCFWDLTEDVLKQSKSMYRYVWKITIFYTKIIFSTIDFSVECFILTQRRSTRKGPARLVRVTYLGIQKYSDGWSQKIIQSSIKIFLKSQMCHPSLWCMLC